MSNVPIRNRAVVTLMACAEDRRICTFWVSSYDSIDKNHVEARHLPIYSFFFSLLHIASHGRRHVTTKWLPINCRRVSVLVACMILGTDECASKTIRATSEHSQVKGRRIASLVYLSELCEIQCSKKCYRNPEHVQIHMHVLFCLLIVFHVDFESVATNSLLYSQEFSLSNTYQFVWPHHLQK